MLFRSLPRASLITGGEGLLLTREAGTSLAAISRQGKLLWIAWPLPWDNSDPRCGRLLALALADTLFEQPLIGRKH